MMAPVINYRWLGFPRHLSEEAYRKQQLGDQWALRVAYYAPWLLHWWMKQSWLPSSTVIKGTTHLPNRLDAQLREYVMKNSGMFEEVGATPVSFFYFDLFQLSKELCSMTLQELKNASVTVLAEAETCHSARHA